MHYDQDMHILYVFDDTVVPDAVQMKTTLLIIDILNFRASIAV